MTEPEVRVRETAEAVAELAAKELSGHLERALEGGDRISLALSGGTTPLPLYRRLARRGGSIDWTRVDLFQADERCVPQDDERSNFRRIQETLTVGLGRPAPRLNRIRGELPAEEAAREYTGLLGRRLEGAPPRLDAVVLGVGGDGHTASIFPETIARPRSHQPWALATLAPAEPRHRVSLSLPVLRAAGLRLVLVTGGSKREVVKRLFGPRRDRVLPAARLTGSPGRTLWVLDAAAAADLVVA